ncbi:MAG: hypothetical protein N2C14_26850, partial [Planctomycetales bacterium]
MPEVVEGVGWEDSEGDEDSFPPRRSWLPFKNRFTTIGSLSPRGNGENDFVREIHKNHKSFSIVTYTSACCG